MKKVDEYIEGLPDERRELAGLLRDLIIENVPGIEERLSFKIPFYHYFGMFMYLNNTKEGIDVAFCRGKDLLDAFPQLELKLRATIATVTVTSKKDISALGIRELIINAAAWNEEAKKLRIPMVKKVVSKKKVK